MCMENGLGCKLVFSRQKISVYYTPKHPNKSVFVSFFHLLSTNTKIINKSQFYLGVNSTYISLYCLALVSHDTSLFISRITISSQLELKVHRIRNKYCGQHSHRKQYRHRNFLYIDSRKNGKLLHTRNHLYQGQLPVYFHP